MKKMFLIGVAAVGIAVMGSGCNSLSDEKKDQIYTYAADKLFDALDSAAKKKLASLLKDGKITQNEYDSLFVRLEESEAKLRALVDELYAKYKDGKDEEQ